MHRVRFVISLAIALSCCTARAEWFATLKLPYNSPGYVTQWESDPQQVLFTLNNHSAVPATIIFELSVKTEALGEIFHGTCVPFTMVNNSPRAFRTTEVTRWKDIVWNPAVRGTLANARRVPEGDVSVCVRVFEWKGGRGLQLAEACEKTNVVYPDVPQPSSPKDDAHVSATPVVCAWQAPDVPADIAIHYRVELAEMKEGAKREDALVHPEVSRYVRSTTTEFQWGLNLKRGGEYAWRVTALDQYGLPATAHAGSSRIQHFHFEAMDDRELDRFNGRAQKSAIAALATAKGDPTAGPILAGADASLNGSPSTQTFRSTATALRTVLDSLSATGSTATVASITSTLAIVEWAGDAGSEKGIGPLDSNLSVCIARALAIRRPASAPFQPRCDSLVHALTAIKGAAATRGSGAILMNIAMKAVHVDEDGVTETPLWHERMDSLLVSISITARLGAVECGAVASAAAAAGRAKRTAPKKGGEALATLRQQIGETATQAATSVAVMREPLDRARATAVAVRSQWKGSPEGARALDGVVSALNECFASINHGGASPLAGVLASLQKAQSSASKKGAAEFDKAISAAREASGKPGDMIAQMRAVAEVKQEVIVHKAKGDKAWSMVPIDALDRLNATGAFTGTLAEFGAGMTEIARNEKDPAVKQAESKLAAYCSDIVRLCGDETSGSVTAEWYAVAEHQRRAAMDCVRDERELGRLGGTSVTLACAPLEEKLIKNLLEKVYLAGADLADVRSAVEKRGLTLMFGKTGGDKFVEIHGTVLMIHPVLATQSVIAVVPHIAAALQDPNPPNAQATFVNMLVARDALKSSKGEGWDARSDFYLDAGKLGEQEMTRMIRATEGGKR